MKKFIVIYHAPVSFREGMKDASPEEGKKEMEAWHAWAQKCGSGLVDFGTPLVNAHKMGKEQHGKSESTVVGYSVLQAESWDEVNKMIKGHPHLGWKDGCEIEVHETMPLPGSA